jgi:tyrosyl-tRNA synthetase
MKVEEKLALAKNNAEEILTLEELKQLFEEKKKPAAYLGMAPTGPYHMAYLVPLGKMYELQKAGVKTSILIANVHAALDDLKAPWDDIDKRGNYYEKCIGLGFPWKEKPDFVKGKDFQMKPDYQLDTLKLSTLTTVKRATRAGSEVCRFQNPKVSELIYPLMQSLDEEYLKVDIQVGGVDQRHILVYAREFMPKIGYRRRVELMTPLVAALKGPGTKMSASDPSSHIKVYDPVERIEKQLKNAYCPEGDVTENPVIQFCQFIVFPIKEKLKIERPEKFGGDVEFNNFENLQTAFMNKEVHPADLKPAVAKALADIFKDVRKYFDKHSGDLEELGEAFLP